MSHCTDKKVQRSKMIDQSFCVLLSIALRTLTSVMAILQTCWDIETCPELCSHLIVPAQHKICWICLESISVLFNFELEEWALTWLDN